jgi:hypothetical protein
LLESDNYHLYWNLQFFDKKAKHWDPFKNFLDNSVNSTVYKDDDKEALKTTDNMLKSNKPAIDISNINISLYLQTTYLIPLLENVVIQQLSLHVDWEDINMNLIKDLMMYSNKRVQFNDRAFLVRISGKVTEGVKDEISKRCNELFKDGIITMDKEPVNHITKEKTNNNLLMYIESPSPEYFKVAEQIFNIGKYIFTECKFKQFFMIFLSVEQITCKQVSK